jgi:hypothetical protein
MLFSVTLFDIVFYGLLATSGISVLYYVYRRRYPNDARLPKAELVASRWRGITKWLPLSCLFGGVIGACNLKRHQHDVIRVHDVDGEPVASRMVRLTEPDYTLAPGQKRSELGFEDTWVLNESSRNVYLETIDYGRSLGFGPSAPIEIPPGTAVTIYTVEYIGPNNRPPEALDVKGFEAKMGSTSRSWLRW